MYFKHEIGKFGEDLAVSFLEEKLGYLILARNFYCKIGEIDIVAKDRDEIVFVEVKTRSQNIFGAPSEAVDFRKKFHIYKVAEFFIMKNCLDNSFFRFDVLEVVNRDNKFFIKHLKNVIYDSPYNDIFYNSFDDDFYYEWSNNDECL